MYSCIQAVYMYTYDSLACQYQSPDNCEDGMNMDHEVSDDITCGYIPVVFIKF